jgi:hypothetical protein
MNSNLLTSQPLDHPFNVQRIRQADDQAMVNEVYRLQGAMAAMVVIRTIADREHAGYPQYNGYWDTDEWTLGRATTTVRSKGGVQAEVGDVVLMRTRHAGGYAFRPDRQFYSMRLGWNCSLSYGVRALRSRNGQEVGR